MNIQQIYEAMDNQIDNIYWMDERFTDLDMEIINYNTLQEYEN